MKNKEVQESLRQVGIRLIEEPPLLSPESMSSPEAAVRVLGEWLSEMDRELFCVVNLNSNLTPINMNVVSMGALNVAYVHPRDAMKSARAKQNLQTYESQLEDAKIEVMKEFPKEADLKEKTDRLSELNALLNMDQSNHEIVAEEQIEEQETAEVTNKTQRNEVVPKFGTR